MQVRCKGDRGQILPLAAGILVMAAVAMVLVVHLGRAATDRARARTAADAAALAGAADGRGAADAIAAANRAVIESYRELDDGVLLSVRVGDARATARAARIAEPCAAAAEVDPVHSARCLPTARAPARPRT